MESVVSCWEKTETNENARKKNKRNRMMQVLDV